MTLSRTRLSFVKVSLLYCLFACIVLKSVFLTSIFCFVHIDCSLVFHRKCQFYVGETCFPSPHLSYFQTPTPAQSVPNLKLLAGGHDRSRPNSRSSQAPNDRSRSATPSQTTSRPAPTPPPSNQRRGSTEHRLMSPPSGSSYTSRVTSPEGHAYDSPSPKNSQRPPSRQEDSPTSPTLDGLRSLLSAQKRFSLGTKKSQSSIGTSKQSNSLPTPPASNTSTNPIPVSRASSSTPDRGALRDHTQPMPVPILKGGSDSRAYRGKQYLPGPLDTCEEDISVRRPSQRRSSINLFSTSAPPVPIDYGQRNKDHYSPFQKLKHPNEDDDDFAEAHTAEMVEEDLEALLIPSIVRSPRRSLDAGHLLIEHRGKSQSVGRTLDRDEFSFASSLDPAHGHGELQSRSTPTARPPHSRSNGYHSSGSSSAAMASSSYSSHTNNNSSTSSLGSVAAMLEEEDRFMKENYPGYPKNGTPSYQVSSQPPQSHHVGIKTMLSRFSNPSGVSSNDSFVGSSDQGKTSTRHQIPVPSTSFSGQGRLSGQAVHPLQSPLEKQERVHDGGIRDRVHGYGQRVAQSSVEDRLGTSHINNEHGYSGESIPPWKRGVADMVAHMGESSGLKRNGKVTRRSIGQDGRWE